MFPQRRKETREVARRIQQEFEKLKSLGYGAIGGKLVFSLLERRIEANPIRAFYVATMAGYAQQYRKRSALVASQQKARMHFVKTQLPFIAEVIISVQYLHNQILDAKSDVDHQQAISKNLLAANLLKSHLQSYIKQEVHISFRQKTQDHVQRAFELVDLGQTIEKHYNTFPVFAKADRMEEVLLPPSLNDAIRLDSANLFIDKIKKDIPRAYWEYLDLYFQRIYLSCAALFVQLTELLIEVVGVKKKAAESMRNFASCYGLMRQLINDNADMVPASYNLQTHAKSSTDAGSDLRNRTITLPLLFHLCEAPKAAIHNYLSNPDSSWSDDASTTFFAEIMQAQSLPKSIQNTRILAVLALQYLDLSQPTAQLLADSCEIAHWNKFLRPCLKHEAYRAYRKTRYCQRTRQLIRALKNPESLCTMPQETWNISGSVSLADARTIIRAYNPTA